MSPNLYSLLLFSLLVSQIFEVSQSQSFPDFCHPYDKKILLNIKYKLGNPPSLASWDPNTDCANWKDVQCGNIEGHVTSISIIDALDVHSPIPPYFDRLYWLTSLNFINVPNLSGPIPSYFGTLTNLTAFIVSGTKLTGPIPRFLNRLTKLNQLDLSSNKLTGPIPNFFGQLNSLSYFDLSSNGLTGPVPTALTQLVNLSYLQLKSNKLSGPIPGFLYKLKNLNTVDFSSNYLTGPIPVYLGHMPGLTTLALSNNMLIGPIPKSLGRSDLGFIKLSHNKLSGDASFLFDKANTNVISVEIDYNFFKFDFTNVDLSRRLVAFNVSHNFIYGSLPKRFGQMWVDSVDVSYNQLCGPIPNGRRFKKVDPTVFSHNKCLCGGPLPACK
ncbi:hypothetical protein RND81_09G165000 [Saponaria officinalis]|uniref:Leucine-rich repeat-containing N-terminal plant-type domain-containing protein n=1 Tax=Saponaria officinalis TaxID=3572 RepID=A0AAW1IMH2_SAPOF